jgi:hypothetical protein
VSIGTALLIGGGIAAVGGVTDALIGSSASKTAAQQQATSDQNAINFDQGVFNTQQANLAPYMTAGNTSLSSLMTGFSNGTFGPGSIPAFTAPTAAQAEATPGYQFNLQQGLKSVDEGAAARGGLQTGGTIKAEQNYGAGLASSTYQQTFGNALSQYQAALTGQSQNYNELAGVADIGLGAATGVNQAGTAAATNISGLMTGQGNAAAAGTIGSANAVAGGISSATGGVGTDLLLSQLLKSPSYTGAGGANPNPNISLGTNVPSLADSGGYYGG